MLILLEAVSALCVTIYDKSVGIEDSLWTHTHTHTQINWDTRTIGQTDVEVEIVI